MTKNLPGSIRNRGDLYLILIFYKTIESLYSVPL